MPLTIETPQAWVEYLCRTDDTAMLLERLDMTDATAAGDHLTVGRAPSGVDRVRGTCSTACCSYRVPPCAVPSPG